MKQLTALITLLLISSTLWAQTRLVEVKVEHGQHQVIKSWIVAGDFHDTLGTNADGDLLVKLWKDEQLLQSYAIVDPNTVHSPLHQDGSDSEHDHVSVDTALYHVRVPDALGVTRITIQRISKGPQLRGLKLVGSVLDYSF